MAGQPGPETLAAGHGAAPLAAAAAVSRALPRDIESFTGRAAELRRLLGELADPAAGPAVVGIHATGGMAGTGTTAFAVHAAHRLAHRFPDGLIFLPLHAHTPGQRPVDPGDAVASLLLATGAGAAQIPRGLAARASRWRDHLEGKRTLLLLDDAAGTEQVRPLLPGSAGSLVLITSRKRLTAVGNGAAIGLDALPPGEAAALLAWLAGRPELGAGAGPAGEITRLCGYLPLAIAMLAGRLRHRPALTVPGLAAELAAAHDRLAVTRTRDLPADAAFHVSYLGLTTGQQRLFRRLGLHPGPTFDAWAAAALDGTDAGTARQHLGGLRERHLLSEPARGRYQLHDLLRRHALALAATDEPAGRDAAVGRLLDYYLSTALAAAKHLPSRATAGGRAPDRPPPSGPPPSGPPVSTAEQAAAWLETERPTLHAAAAYAAANARPGHAMAISAAVDDFLTASGHWDQALALHRTGLAAARESGDRPGQARALHLLATMQRMARDYPAAAATKQQPQALYGELGDLPGQAGALNQLGIVQRLAGDYRAAASSHRAAFGVAREAGDRLGQAQAASGLGTIQRLAGDYRAAATSHRQALALFRHLVDLPGEASALNELGVVQRLAGDHLAAATSHEQALAQFREVGDWLGQAEALNNLGELLSSSRIYQRARDHHAQALAIARDIGALHEEAHALEGIGLCRIHQGALGEGATLLRQALMIYQRIGAPAAERLREILRDRPPALPGHGDGG